MRKLLTIGAVICCLIGFGVISSFIYGIVEVSPHAFFNGTGNFIALSVFAVFELMAFAPIIMLKQTKKVEKPRFRFVFIGVAEIIVIALFIGMLFPKL
jgi:hypothetical protein